MTRIFIVCFTVIAGILVSAIANEYCKLTCKGIYKHTMCLYPSPNPGPACIKPHDQGLTNAEKDAILRKHNELRKKVASGKEARGKPGPQPAAINMPDLTWDDELATIAQRWANQCIFEHDKCRISKRFSVGQNIAYDSNADATVVTLTQDWYDEVKKFDRRIVSRFESSTEIISHYTQIIWADTTKLGCGKIRYTDSERFVRLYLVCNYGPIGNWIGEPIYKIKT